MSNGRMVVVVANGLLPDPTWLRPLLEGADLVVAADGGAQTLLAAGLPLHVVVGDMDSLPPATLDRWRRDGGETVVYPAHKDETDLELALRLALQREAGRVTILGALGGRVDHQLANLLLLAAPLLAGVPVEVRDARTRVVAIRAEATLRGQPGDLLSLLPLTGRVEGIQTSGLRYPLRGEALVLGVPRGVSNVFTDAHATVSVSAGILLAVHSWPEDRAAAW